MYLYRNIIVVVPTLNYNHRIRGDSVKIHPVICVYEYNYYNFTI